MTEGADLKDVDLLAYGAVPDLDIMLSGMDEGEASGDV